jgi:hypothetical protein
LRQAQGDQIVLVITAGTAEYGRMIFAQGNKCMQFGYQHAAYDLGDLGFGIRADVPASDLRPTYKESLPPSTFKPGLLIENSFYKGTLCWLDGDCIPIQPFEPGGDWDIAVTLRPKSEIGRSGNPHTSYLNSGVVWIRNAAIGFAVQWELEAKRINTDQGALNNLVGPNFSSTDWKNAMGKTITTPNGFKVRVLDAAEWNCWNIPPGDNARILHFKRDRRHLGKGYF